MLFICYCIFKFNGWELGFVHVGSCIELGVYFGYNALDLKFELLKLNPFYMLVLVS